MERPDFFELKNGSKVKLPFSDQEYKNRLNKIRETMSKKKVGMVILTSMHNIAYYTGFIYCSFGRPYGCVITEKKIVTISANIDASQPWRRSNCDNVIYTDWKRDNFLRAIVSIIGREDPPKNIGIEEDHLTLEMMSKVKSIFTFSTFKDVSKDLMNLRMIKSKEEIEIIKTFLPKQMSDDEVEYAVRDAISDSGASSIKEMGQIMGILRGKYAGRMDFGRASALVKEKLS